MRLNHALPRLYEYEGKQVEIDLSFDNVLDIFDVLQMKHLLEKDLVELVIILLFGEGVILPKDYIVVWKDVFEKYMKPTKSKPAKYDIAGNPMPDPEKNDEITLDLQQDAEYIYASFIQAYNINLFERQQDLHWLEFRALLQGLPEDTIMKQIMSIRGYVPDKNDSSEYKKQMKKLQTIYKLEER